MLIKRDVFHVNLDKIIELELTENFNEGLRIKIISGQTTKYFNKKPYKNKDTAKRQYKIIYNRIMSKKYPI